MATKKPRKLSAKQQRAYDTLVEATLVRGMPLPSSYGLSPNLKGVTSDQWRDELIERRIIEQDRKKNPHARFSELRDKLAAKHLIGVRGEMVWAAA
jgi:hypothetical protein